jgi:hypothetical protein
MHSYDIRYTHCWGDCSLFGPREVIKGEKFARVVPCGGGVEYLHRNPAIRRRRRKGTSRIWESKIWSRVPRDSDPRMNALVRTSSTFKQQTHLSSERAPHINKHATAWQSGRLTQKQTRGFIDSAVRIEIRGQRVNQLVKDWIGHQQGN